MIRTEPPQSTPVVITRNATRPVLWWATIGGAFVLLSVYIYADWLASPNATPSPKGADPLPTATHVWLWVYSLGSVILAAVAVWHVVRTSRREGRLSFDGVLMLGWMSVAWQDPVLSYVRPAAFYNAYFPNLGSWVESIPGWISPHGSRLPEPFPLVIPGCYLWPVLTSILCCAIMRKAKEHRPHLGNVSLILVGFASVALLDLVLEGLSVRTGIYGFPTVVHGLSLWGGTDQQFPLYEPVLWGAMWATTGVLRYFRDDNGRSVVERGADQLRATPRQRTVVRVLAVCGFLNVAFLVLYNIPFIWFTLHSDATPVYPSYLRAGICGPDTAFDCPSPHHPIPLPGSPPDRPELGR